MLDGFAERAHDFVVGGCGLLHFGGIADEELKAVAGEAQPAYWFRRRHGQINQALEGGVLLLDSFAVRFVDRFDSRHQAGFGRVLAPGRNWFGERVEKSFRLRLPT